MSERIYVAASDLKRAGWTEGLIKKLLGAPDAQQPNPHNSLMKMRLYRTERVEAVIATAEFAELKALSEQRSQRAKALAEARAAKLAEQAKLLTVAVRVVHDGSLLTASAIRAYNARNINTYDSAGEFAMPTSPPEFLERITVNYIRHELTDYDRELSQQAHKAGAEAARRIIRHKVYAAIADAYPRFAAECQRQIERRSAE